MPDPIVRINQNPIFEENPRLIHNQVNEPEPGGLGNVRTVNDLRRMENIPLPQVPMVGQPLVSQVRNQQIGMDRNDIINIVQEIYGPMARGVQTPVYRKPYPEYIDRIELPRGIKLPVFSLFSGDGSQSTVEHIARYVSQGIEFGNNDLLKLRLFSNSLTDAAFIWFINLPPNSIHTWQQMEDIFHAQFF